MAGRVAMGARVLRVGVVQGGVLRAERSLQAGQTLRYAELEAPELSTLGAQPLLRAAGRGWTLCVPEGASGRVQGADGPRELALLLSAPGRAGLRELAVGPGMRGKVALPGVTVLFQELPAPPEADLAQFRPALFGPEDRLFGRCLGGSLALGLVFGTWAALHPPIQHTEVFALDRLPAPVVLMVQAPPPPEPILERPAPARAERQVARRERAEPTPALAPAAATPQRSAEELVEARSALLTLIAGRGPNPGGLRALDRLADGAVEEELDRLLAQRTGAEVAQADGPTLRDAPVERRGVDIGELASLTPGDAVELGEAPTRVLGEVGEAPEGSEAGSADPGGASELTALVRKNLGGIKYCYDTVLRTDPTASGRVELYLAVEAGVLTELEVLRSDIQSPEFVACLERAARRWPVPADLSGAVEYPLILNPGAR